MKLKESHVSDNQTPYAEMYIVPNLDGMWPDDLDRYVTLMRELASLLDDLDLVAQDLANYAQAKAQAVRYRAQGDLERALPLERGCDRIYQRLPEWARW